jgi:restriction endonuclease S subunit
VCEINPKKAEVSILPGNTIVSFLPMEDIGTQENIIPQAEKSISEVYKGYTYFRDNDILVAKVTPCFENGKSGIARNLKNGIGFGTTELHVIRTSDKIVPEFVYRFLSSEKFRDTGKPYMTGTGGLQRLPAKFVSDFTIPLPPLPVQQEIVAEVEACQRVIDHARGLVDAWKPQIEVDPEWPVVKLGDVFKLSSGRFLPKDKRGDGEYLVYGGNGVTGKHTEYFVEERTLVIGRVGEYCGNVCVTKPKSWITDNALMVTEYLQEVNQEYLSVIINQMNLNQYAKRGGQPSISQDTVCSKTVPLPPLVVQR